MGDDKTDDASSKAKKQETMGGDKTDDASSKAKKQRTSAKGRFTRTKNNLRKAVDEKHDTTIVQDWLEEMNTAFPVVEEKHAAFCEALSDEEAEKEEAWMNEVNEQYAATKTMGMTYIKNNSKSGEDSESSGEQKSNLKPIEMKMPKFEGDPRDYPRFKSDFTSQIQPRLKPSETGYILRSCLGKTPLEMVKYMGDSVTDIWKRLDEEYGDPSRLTDLILHDIKSFQLGTSADEKFLEFVAILEKGYHDLKYLEMENEMSNAGIVSIIESKLPPEIREKWAYKITEDGNSHRTSSLIPHGPRLC